MCQWKLVEKKKHNYQLFYENKVNQQLIAIFADMAVLARIQNCINNLGEVIPELNSIMSKSECFRCMFQKGATIAAQSALMATFRYYHSVPHDTFVTQAIIKQNIALTIQAAQERGIIQQLAGDP